LLVCDIQNLYYGVKEEYGVQWRLSFPRLKSFVECLYQPDLLIPTAFVSLTPEKLQGVVNMLEGNGYEVVWRASRHCGEGRGQLSGTDVDALVSVRVIERIDDFDMLVIASGDADYIPLYNYVKDKGKRVEVMAFSAGLARDVEATVDGVHLIGEELLYFQEPKREAIYA
jgi:uncharacterized LabA/DUF88 family protein